MFRKAALVLVAPLFAAGACATQADPSHQVLTGDAAVAALRAAPDAAAAAGSGRFEMTMAFDTPDGAFEMLATGGYSGQQMAMEMDFGSMLADLAASTGESIPAGFDEPMRIVVDGTTAYMRIPMLGALTGESGWLSLTAEDMGMAGDTFGLGVGANDPTKMLETLRGVIEGDLEEKGPAEVRGVATTRFGAVIDLAKALSQVPEAQRATVEAMLEGIDPSLARMPVDVWIDDAGLVRRMSMQLDGVLTAAIGAGATASITIEMFDYGQPVDIEVPAPEDTTPYGDVLGAFGGAG